MLFPIHLYFRIWSTVKSKVDWPSCWTRVWRLFQAGGFQKWPLEALSLDFSCGSTPQWRHNEAGFLRSHGIWWLLGPFPRTQVGRLLWRKGGLIARWILWGSSSLCSSQNIKMGVWARTTQTRLTDESHTTWTLTLPMTLLGLPIIQGKFAEIQRKLFSWACLSWHNLGLPLLT